MAPRANPEAISQGRKAAKIERVVGEGIPRQLVEQWVESYEGGAADMHDLRRDPGFWDNAHHFTIHEWSAGHKPPPPPDISSDERDPVL